MNIISFLLGYIAGTITIVIIASISAYKEVKLKQKMALELANNLNKTVKKTTKVKKGE